MLDDDRTLVEDEPRTELGSSLLANRYHGPRQSEVSSLWGALNPPIIRAEDHSGEVPVSSATQYCGKCRRTYSPEHPFCPLDGSRLDAVPGELPEVSTVLHDRYLILGSMGSGGMGAIFRAHDMRRRCEVALKVLKPTLAVKEKAVRRFFVEARAARRLEHPNIVKLFDFGVSHEGFLYLSMELLPGITLAQLLSRKGRLTTGEALLVALGVSEALIHAHDNGVVHRDLKPENIFLVAWDKEGFFTKVLDFGVAAVADASVRGSLHRGEVLGTPAYMSPEQVRGDAVDRRSDIYSLGIVLYEMLSGSPPFIAQNASEIMRAQLTMEPAPLPPLALTPTVRQGLDQLVRSMLAKKVQDRPVDASEVRARMRAVRDNLAVDDAAAVDAELFREALTPLRGMVPFHERQTMAVEVPAEKPDDFHFQPTVVLDPHDVHPAQGAPTLLQDRAVGPGLDSERRRSVPWTLNEAPVNGDRNHKDNGNGGNGNGKGLMIALVHTELDFGHEDSGLMPTREMFAPEMEAFEAETMALGGNVCFDSGDEVRVVFGLYDHDRSPWSSALKAGLDLVNRVERFREATGLPVSARVGVSTDKVPPGAAGSASPDSALRGSSVDVAVRLARMAKSGQIVLDDVTRGKVIRTSTCEEIGRIRVRGRERNTRIFGLVQ